MAASVSDEIASSLTQSQTTGFDANHKTSHHCLRADAETSPQRVIYERAGPFQMARFISQHIKYLIVVASSCLAFLLFLLLL